MGKSKKLTKGNKAKLDKKPIGKKSGKITKSQTSKQDKKSNLKKEIRKTKDIIEKSNLDYDAIRERLTMPKELIKPKIVKNPAKFEPRAKEPLMDMESSFDEIERLCRTNIQISDKS